MTPVPVTVTMQGIVRPEDRPGRGPGPAFVSVQGNAPAGAAIPHPLRRFTSDNPDMGTAATAGSSPGRLRHGAAWDCQVARSCCPLYFPLPGGKLQRTCLGALLHLSADRQVRPMPGNPARSECSRKVRVPRAATRSDVFRKGSVPVNKLPWAYLRDCKEKGMGIIFLT